MPDSPPDTLLLMGKQCPYCPAVLQTLKALKSDGTIGKLETLIIENHPEQAAEFGVRTVPWVRIGPFELEGLRSEQELRDWANKASTQEGLESYLDELLSTGSIEKGLALVREYEGGMAALLSVFANSDTRLNTRIGISAIMEGLREDRLLIDAIGELSELASHKDASIRGDACYFLSLTGTEQDLEIIRHLLNDPDASVREIAADSLESKTEQI